MTALCRVGAGCDKRTDCIRSRGGEGPAEIDTISRDFAANDPDGYAACYGASARMDLRALLPDIAVQTLVIAGQQDPATPVAMSEFLCDQIPKARLVLREPAAHLLAVEQPTAVASLLAVQIARAVSR